MGGSGLLGELRKSLEIAVRSSTSLDLRELFTCLDHLLAEHALLRRPSLLLEKAQPILLSRTARELDLRNLMHIAAIAHGMVEVRWVQPGFDLLASAKLEIRALGVDGQKLLEDRSLL